MTRGANELTAVSRITGAMTDDRQKSLQDLAENQRWLDEHADQTVHPGDLPISEQPLAKTVSHETSDQQQ